MMSLRAVGGALSAVLLLAAGALTFMAAEGVEPPTAAPVALGTVHNVPAGVTRIACAPTPLIAEGAVAYDPEFNPVPATSSATLVAASVPRGDDGAGPAAIATSPAGEPTALWGTAALVGSADPGAEAAVVVAEPLEGVAPLAAAAGIWRSDAGDLRSLTALPCSVALAEQWLVGGATEVGSSAALTITNPGATPVTVTVSGWGPLGPVDLPMLSGLVIAPYASETYLLEASDSTLERLALRVQSAGGAVGASLLETRLDGLTPLGTATVAPSAPPGTALVVPAVSLTDVPEDAGESGLQSFVRVLNPGTAPATLTLTLLTAEGEVGIAGATDVTVDPGAVFDIAIDGLPAGDHSVAVVSDQPVVAAAHLVRHASDGGADRAWSGAATPSSLMTVAVPGLGAQADAATLVVANPSAEEVAVRVTPYGADGAAGEVREVSVPARASIGVVVEGAPVALQVESDEPVAAALLLRAGIAEGELVAILPATPDAATAHAVTVTVREG
nr:hypothetical protein [Actinomycetales bacterium]